MPKSSGAAAKRRAPGVPKVEPQSQRRGRAGKQKTKPKAPAQPDLKKTAKAQPKPPTKPKTKPAKSKTDRRGTPRGKATRPGRGGGRIGNPPFVATDDQRASVEQLAAVGTPHWLIAEELRISEDTLTRHFGPELERGLMRINARIGSQVAKAALEGDKASRFFWLKTRGGWKERTVLEHTGENGAPIKHEVSPEWDLSGLSRADLKALKELSQKARPDAPPSS
jgi:hypothetical protein